MSTYESEDFVRFSLRTTARRLGYIWLMVVLIIMGGSLAQAESLTTSAATGAIRGKITDQGGKPLAGIQVLAMQQLGGISGYATFPYDLSAFPPWVPEELSGDPGFNFYPYSPYSSFSPYGGYPLYGYPAYTGSESNLPQVYEAVSTADGTFLLDSLPEGRYRLWAYDLKGRGFVPSIYGLDVGKVVSTPYSTSYSPYFTNSSVLIRVHAGQTAGPLSLAMTMGGKLSGQVTDATTGKPISGARIMASSQNNYSYSPAFSVLSDSGGNFTFPGLAEGTYRLDAGAEGYFSSNVIMYSQSYGNYVVSAGQTTGGCNITLKRGGAVSGKITSQADGKPVAGAEVVCFNGTSGYCPSTPVISKADGTYRISGLMPGTYFPLVQSAPGFQGAYYPNTQDIDMAGEIQVEEGKEAGSINFQLAPTGGKGIIRGRIIDKNSGLPVAGIQVILNKSYYDPVNPIPLPMPVDLATISGPGGAVIMRNRADAVSGAAPVNEVSITSAPQTGYASYAAPPATAAPELVSTGMAVTVSAYSEPAVDSSTAGAPATPTPPVAVPPLSSTSALLGYGAPSGVVSSYLDSQISSRSYLPSINYTRYEPVLTDAQGRFEFTGLVNGGYELSIYDPISGYLGTRYPEYPTGNWSLYVPDYLELTEQKTSFEGIEIALQKGGTLQGKVLAGSTPLAGISVSAIISGNGDKGSSGGYPGVYSYGGALQDMTDTDGEFIIRGLAEDGYMVVAMDQTGARNVVATFCLDQSAGEETPATFKVAANSTTGDIIINMKPGASISGRVTDKSGKPLAGIMISVDRESYPTYDWDKQQDSYFYESTRNAVTDQDGTYTLAGLSGGTYVLRAWDQNQKYLDGCQSGISVSPPDGISVPDMVLIKSLILSGKVTSTDGTPLPDVMVTAALDTSSAGGSGQEPSRTAHQTGAYDYCTAYSYSKHQAQGYTGKDGTWQITGLAAGSYRLEAVDHQNGYLSAKYGTGSSPALITGAQGEEKTGLDFRLSRGGIIQGRVSDKATGEPVSGVTIMAQQLMPSSTGQSYPYGQTASSGDGYGGYLVPYGTSYGSPPGSEYGLAVPDMTPEASPLVKEGPDADDDRGELYLKVTRGQAGEAVKIPVIIRTGSNEVSTLGFELTYDPAALEYLGFEKTELASSLSMFDVSLLDPGRIRVGGYSFTGSIPSGACDYLVLLKFKVDGGLLNQCYPLELGNLMDDLTGFAATNGSFCTFTAEPYGTYPAPMPANAPVSAFAGEPMPSAALMLPAGPAVTAVAPTVVKPVEPPLVPTTVPPSLSPLPPPPPVPTSVMPTDYWQYPGLAIPTGKIYTSIPTDSQGNYTLQGLADGKYLLFISTTEKNYLSQYYPGVSSESEATPIEIRSDQVVENIDFSLAPGSILKGVIRDAETGKPITTGCSVRLTTEQGLDIRRTSYVSTGEYQFKGLCPGTYLIRVTGCQNYCDGSYRLPGTDPQSSSPITISAPGPVEGIDILLQPKSSISGRVVDEIDHQTPLAKIIITAIPKSPYSKPYASDIAYYASSSLYYSPAVSYAPAYYYGYQAITDAEGRYAIRGLEEGDYLIMAYDPAYVYGREYYRDIPVNQPDKATAIHVGRSEAKGGIDLELQVGETYTGTASSQKQSTTDASYGSSAVPGSSYGYSNYYLQATGSSSGLYGGLSSYSAAYAQSGTAQNPAQNPLPPEQPVNTEPPEIISSNSVDRVRAGRTFTYQVEAKSLSPDVTLKHSLLLGPEGMNIDPDTGLVQWSPSNEDAGSCIVQLMVDNGNGQVASQSFRLRVEEDTTPPAEVKGLIAVKGDGKVILSWTPSEDRDGDLADQILFIKEGQEYGAGISLGEDTSGYTVDNLKNNQPYTFKIVTVDNLENTSTGVTVTATPAREQAAITGASSWPSPWYPGLTSTNYLSSGNTAMTGLWMSSPFLPSSSLVSTWPSNTFTGWGSPSWMSSSWIQSNNLFGSSNLWSSPSWSSWTGSNSAGTSLYSSSSSSLSSWLNNSSIGFWGGNSIWGGSSGSFWNLNNQNSLTGNLLQSRYLFY